MAGFPDLDSEWFCFTSGLFGVSDGQHGWLGVGLQPDGRGHQGRDVPARPGTLAFALCPGVAGRDCWPPVGHC